MVPFCNLVGVRVTELAPDHGQAELPVRDELVAQLKSAGVRHVTHVVEGRQYVSVNVPRVGRWPKGQNPGGVLHARSLGEAEAEAAKVLM